MSFYPLSCPICQHRLYQEAQTWRCDNRHSYDQAKQGYVNLHVVQQKHSKNPGDTPTSVAARRRFLSSGGYQKLQQFLVDITQKYQIKTMLDIGCGEGYYTQALSDVVTQCIAVDIAKSAVQIAAKQDQQKQVCWVVGTGASLPVDTASMQLCTSFFSPLPKEEMYRVLEEQGYVLMATPAPQHLFAMREALFDDVKAHEPEKFLAQLQPEFELVEQAIIEDQLMLTQQQLHDLIAMTPYAYKAKPERRQALEQQTSFAVTAQFAVYLLRKVAVTAEEMD